MGGWAGPAAMKETWHWATRKTWCCAKPEMTKKTGETSGDIGKDEEDLWLGGTSGHKKNLKMDGTSGRGRTWTQEVIRKSITPD